MDNSSLNLNSRLEIKHSSRQKEYALYKKKLLERENIKIHFEEREEDYTPSKIGNRIIKDNGFCKISTQRNINFNIFRDLYYKNNKAINENIYKLSALGLAIWYMDDGYKHSSSYYLCSNNFSLEDNNLLKSMLQTNFNIESSIHKNRGKYLLYIKAKSKDVFTNLIKPYVCPSMLYKLHWAA